MSHHVDLFNVGHGSENGKRPPQKKTWQLLTDVKRLERKTMLCIISIFHLALFEEIERNENERNSIDAFVHIYHFTFFSGVVK